MPHYNVRMCDGRWRVYSTVVDDFITGDMTFSELAEWRKFEYGNRGGSTDRETASLLTSKPECNVMEWHEAIERAAFMQGTDPCPKCGCEDLGWDREFDSDGYVSARMFCPKCGMSMRWGGIPEEYEQICGELVGRWNS